MRLLIYERDSKNREYNLLRITLKFRSILHLSARGNKSSLNLGWRIQLGNDDTQNFKGWTEVCYRYRRWKRKRLNEMRMRILAAE